ncbi:hypothetical protein JCM17845_10610 [Iodidimonas gelatinilytica]|uniref:Uncharacterized protein n=1 Tax=Iodidimonas gelatinilytica TaxID=1236966 RepID=A0A5A7MX47_9PROT|nr:hypothetical protein [Iodidimonas gelatinilytica]GER00438.1 hypothetical protein JCM17845_10610 [Iodidimonas gelatinilytica]
MPRNASTDACKDFVEAHGAFQGLEVFEIETDETGGGKLAFPSVSDMGDEAILE